MKRRQMAKSKNNLPSLINNLTTERSKSPSLLLANLVGTSFSGTNGNIHVGSSGDTRLRPFDFTATPHSIDFGRPPAEKASSSKSGNGWTEFLKQAAGVNAAFPETVSMMQEIARTAI